MNPRIRYFLLISIPILIIFSLFICFAKKIVLKNLFLLDDIMISDRSSDGVCVTQLQSLVIYTNFCPEDVNHIPLNISYSDGTEIRKLFNRTIILFDPNGKGNYTVALLNLLYALPKQGTWIVCTYYNPGCRLYLYNETQSIYIIYPTKQNNSYILYYKVPKNSSFVILLNLGNTTKIIQEDYNLVLIEGTNSTIRKAVDRFIFWWYGIYS